MPVRKIAVTGTKGKTTVVNMLAEVLIALGHKNVLHVNTTGHFIDGKRRSTADDSKRIWGLVPSVSPGRFLYEFADLPREEDGFAVLEASLGSSTLSGMGYAMHGIGIFLNVFEDHIGSSKRISSQDDIVEAKRFVFKRLLKDGFAVLNADDERVMETLKNVEARDGAKAIFFGLNADGIKENHPDEMYVAIREGKVVCFDGEEESEIVSVKDVVWTFDGAYTPSTYNLLAVVAGVFALHKGELKGELPKSLGTILKETRLDKYGGRLTLLRNEKDVTVLMDYAHEKKSLCEIAGLARTLTKNGGKIIGVVRLAYDRSDELIEDTGKTIADKFDSFVVYDKIDGHFKKPKERLQYDRFTQEVGKVSETFSNAIRTRNEHVERIIREDYAIAHAAEIAEPGDVVVCIVNDDIKRSIGFVQKYFDAQFV